MRLSNTEMPNISSLPPTMELNLSCTPDEEFLRVPFTVFYSLLFFFGLLGNLLALWVFLFLQVRRNSVRVFLINVALADLVLVACLPFRVLYHALGNHWPLGPHACKMVGNLFYMNMYVSITLLGLISLDRYLKIQGARAGRRGCGRRWFRGSKWSMACCGVLWATSLTAVVPMIALAEGNEEHGKCFQYKLRTTARGKAYFNLFLVGIFWLVFMLLVVSYSRIACGLLRASRDRPELPNSMRYARTAKKSFVVLFLFTVCFVPYHSFRGVYVHSQLSDTPCEFRRFANRTNEIMLLLSALNSCLDPVMYFMLSGSVRKATLRTFLRVFFFRTDDAVPAGSSTTEFHRTTGSQTSTYVLATPRGSVGLISTIQPNSRLGVAPCGARTGLCEYQGLLAEEVVTHRNTMETKEAQSAAAPGVK